MTEKLYIIYYRKLERTQKHKAQYHEYKYILVKTSI